MNWWLVRWRLYGKNVVRTNWYKEQHNASTKARTEKEKGHTVTDYRAVSGNGKRQ
jgi:hypothetical protein